MSRMSQDFLFGNLTINKCYILMQTPLELYILLQEL